MYLIIDIVVFWILSLVVISTSVFMIMALTKFIKIVARRQNLNFNQWQIMIQILGLSIWTVARLAYGVILMMYNG